MQPPGGPTGERDDVWSPFTARRSSLGHGLLNLGKRAYAVISHIDPLCISVLPSSCPPSLMIYQITGSDPQAMSTSCISCIVFFKNDFLLYIFFLLVYLQQTDCFEAVKTTPDFHLSKMCVKARRCVHTFCSTCFLCKYTLSFTNNNIILLFVKAGSIQKTWHFPREGMRICACVVTLPLPYLILLVTPRGELSQMRWGEGVRGDGGIFRWHLPFTHYPLGDQHLGRNNNSNV